MTEPYTYEKECYFRHIRLVKIDILFLNLYYYYEVKLSLFYKRHLKTPYIHFDVGMYIRCFFTLR